jgi:hypothetical protein
VQAGQQVPTQHPQPQTQPGQSYVPQTQQQPHAATNGIDPNTVLQGPAFPPELQGVTLGQAITMYGGMRNLVLGLQARQAQQVATPQQQPQQHPQQPSPLAGQQGQGQSAFDWRNPAPGIAAIVGQVLDERLAPMQQQSAIQAAGTVRATVAQEIGVQRFAQLEPAVMRYLAGASPQDLANPDLWRVAIRAAAGEAYLNGQQGQPQRQPAGQAYGGAVPFQPGMQNPAPPLQSFFTEAPQAGQPVQGVTLTPAQMWIADQMGISQADYAAYASGVPQRVPQNGGRV